MAMTEMTSNRAKKIFFMIRIFGLSNEQIFSRLFCLLQEKEGQGELILQTVSLQTYFSCHYQPTVLLRYIKNTNGKSWHGLFSPIGSIKTEKRKKRFLKNIALNFY